MTTIKIHKALMPPRHIKNRSVILQWIKVGFFAFISLIMLIENCILCFLGVRLLLLTIIPAIPDSLLITSSIIMSCVSAIQFIAFDIELFKSLLGIYNRKNTLVILNLHKKQNNSCHNINNALMNVNIISNIINNPYASHKKRAAIRGLRCAVTGFGAFMIVAGTYFSANMLLKTLAAGLLGTPIAWLITGTHMISSLAFYFTLQRTLTDYKSQVHIRTDIHTENVVNNTKNRQSSKIYGIDAF